MFAVCPSAGLVRLNAPFDSAGTAHHYHLRRGGVRPAAHRQDGGRRAAAEERRQRVRGRAAQTGVRDARAGRDREGLRPGPVAGGRWLHGGDEGPRGVRLRHTRPRRPEVRQRQNDLRQHRGHLRVAPRVSDRVPR